MHSSHILTWNFQIAHIFTWNFQIAFLTAYLVFLRRSKWAFEISWKHFVPNSGVATSLAEIVDDKKWRSAWVVINPDKHSWYIIERCYWKLNVKTIPSEEKKCWLENDLCLPPIEGKEIPRCPTTWLNNRIMRAAQKLIWN